MIQNNFGLIWINNFPVNGLVWILTAATMVVGTGQIGNELDANIAGAMSIGMASGEINQGHESVIGNNSVTAVQPGDSARLACPIPAEMYGTKVSWIRRGDLQLLAVGDNVYAHDHRLFVSHSRHSHNAHHSQVWFLHLTNVTKRDEGEYECQTSTHPHVSIFTFLKVQNAYSRVEGPEDRVVASGSSLRLVCTIEGASSPPSYVFWYHFERMVNYDSLRGISVTKPTPFRSTLRIAEATVDHIGNYTCQPSNAFPASVNVHVVAESTESSAHGRVGKKVAEKTPVRPLGVKSPTSGGSVLVCPGGFFSFLCLLLAHAILVPSLLDFTTRIPDNNINTLKNVILKDGQNDIKRTNFIQVHGYELQRCNSYVFDSESLETRRMCEPRVSGRSSQVVFQLNM